jgi:hypothetical protein
VLDLCVALTERQDEDEQMRQVAKQVSLTQPAPIQVDSTEPGGELRRSASPATASSRPRQPTPLRADQRMRLHV